MPHLQIRDQVLNKLINSNLLSDKSLKYFKETFLSVVNTIAPSKSRFIPANKVAFINKDIRRGTMVRSKLRKKFLKSRSESDKKAYNKQRNKCVSLLRKTKKAYYSNLDGKDVVDNGKQYKVSSLITQTILKTYLLLKNGNLLTNETFNKYFEIFYFAKHQKMVMKL